MIKRVRKVIIMGAGGRDFHNFLVYYKDNPNYEVVAFTATQIPGIANRIFPAKLAGRKYPRGIKIYPESLLPNLIKKFRADEVVLSYSDLSYREVSEIRDIIRKHKARFRLLSVDATMLLSKKPVVAVTAVRTGCGKSQTARKVAEYFRKKGQKVAVIRHPMPYGNLIRGEIQRFATHKDLKKYNVTIEEREEYEPHLRKGSVVWAGVNYEKILRKAEKESDIIVWDGGNNDTPFFNPDLWIVVTDPHRPGHEITYYPGRINFERADVIVINKVDTANKAGINEIKKNANLINPKAKIIEAASPITVDKPSVIKRKKVLVMEDGPTTTHGGMSFGAGTVAAKRYKCKIVSPKKNAVGSIRKIFHKYPYLNILPTMGYNKQQIKELETTINRTKADAVIDGTPTDLSKLIKINKPIAEVSYELKEKRGRLADVLKNIKIRKR